MSYVIYNLALIILSPAIALFILYRILISGKSRKSWRQQMGFVNLPGQTCDKDRIWIHAVSVGESVAGAAVIAELKKSLPDAAVVVSTTTQTGQQMAIKSVEDADGFFYYPFDIVPFVARSLSRVNPIVFASTDTEIWPNFLHLAHARGTKTAIINGTISDKTVAGARRVPWLYRWALSNVDAFCMQSQADAERVIALGANPAKVTVTGNCKADQAGEPLGEADKQQLRSDFGLPDQARVFVAGSTNPGEDEPMIDAFLAARKSHPDFRLIIAPRQIERAEEICSLASARGLNCGRRSDPATPSGDRDVMILDTFGELARVYAIADITFVGGSLIRRGCHSILQPIAQGKGVFFGPHTFKAKDLVAQAKAAGVGFQIRDGDELGEQITKMLGDTALLEDIRARCESMMKSNQGASQRTAAALVELYRSALTHR